MAEITINLTPAEYDRTLQFLASIQGIEGTLNTILENQVQILQIGAPHLSEEELQQLEAQVSKTEGVENSAGLAFKLLAAKLIAAANEPARILAIAKRLNDSADTLAAAVAENPGTPTPA